MIGIAIIHYYIICFVFDDLRVVYSGLVPGNEFTGHGDVFHILKIFWLACTAATLGGAIGAGLESEETVLKAPCGYRQRVRKERTKTEKSKILLEDGK